MGFLHQFRFVHEIQFDGLFFHRLAPDLLNGGLLNGGNPLSGFPLENDTRWRSHGGLNGRFIPRPIMSTGMLRTDLMPRS